MTASTGSPARALTADPTMGSTPRTPKRPKMSRSARRNAAHSAKRAAVSTIESPEPRPRRAAGLGCPIRCRSLPSQGRDAHARVPVLALGLDDVLAVHPAGLGG